MLIAVPALVAGWALAGFYGSLGPALIAHLTRSHSPALGGLSLFILTASAALAVPLLKGTPPRTVMLIGTIALFVGVAITLLATTISSAALFLVGTAIAGVGFGGAFQGAIRTIAPLAAPHERGAVLSSIYLASYVALGLPAIVAGVLVASGSSIVTTSREYGATIMLLAALATLGLIVQRRSRRRACVPVAESASKREGIGSRLLGHRARLDAPAPVAESLQPQSEGRLRSDPHQQAAPCTAPMTSHD
jgi:MFS family permease